MRTEDAQEQYYARYYQRTGPNRNDVRTNRGVLWQLLAAEASLITAFHRIRLDTSSAKLLDVGCGQGTFYRFMRLGFKMQNMTGIDIQSERLAEGRIQYPQAHLIQGDATQMKFANDSFDLVTEAGLLTTIPDDHTRRAIAGEMVRVCRAAGYLLIIDWRTPYPGRSEYKALSRSELNHLFRVGTDTSLITVSKGALIPPIGRFLSRWLPSLYFVVSALCPFIVGQVAYVLIKRPNVAS